MLSILLLAAAAAASAHHRAIPQPVVTDSAAAVVDRQRRQPPRQGRAAGLSPEEADVVMSEYLSSIGKRLVTDSQPSGPHP